MQFWEYLRHRHTTDELLLHNILRTDEACFTREGVLNVHNSHLCARDNPHDMRGRGYEARFSINVWTRIAGDIVMGPCPLPDRLTAQKYRDILESIP